MNVLSLFSGIGGLELGLERAGMTTVGQVELDPFCRKVLAKHWPEVPRHDDVRTAAEWWQSEPRPTVDIICGGFPCQDISEAGAGVGITGARSGLWAWMAYAVGVLRPRYVLVENVSALLVRGLGTVLADLACIGYDAEWSCVSACSMGAPHTRERLFVLAYPNPRGQQARGAGRDRDDTPLVGRRAGSEHLHAATQPRRSTGGTAWAYQPDVRRMADGLSPGMDRSRLKALGNAVVPQVAEHIGRLILEADSQRVAA